MGQRTKIQYVHHTWNPIRGCEHALLPDGSEHPGCAHCYAEAMSKRNPLVLGTWGAADAGGVRTVAAPGYWGLLRQWNAAAAKAQERRRVMVSMFDPFEAWSGPMHSHRGRQLWVSDEEPQRLLEWLDGGLESLYPVERRNFEAGIFRPLTFDDVRSRMFEEIDRCEWLDVLLFSKRPQFVREMWCSHVNTDGKPPSQLHRHNVWLIYSASDQRSLEEGVPHLLACRDLVPVLGMSLEPLLGSINLGLRSDGVVMCRRCCWGDRCDDPTHFHRLDCPHCKGSGQIGALDWITVGGESGPRARPCRLGWIRGIVQQCRDAAVPCYVKQLGSQPVKYWHQGECGEHPDGSPCPTESGLGAYACDHSKGGDPDEWPADLRVQQFPSPYQIAAAGATVEDQRWFEQMEMQAAQHRCIPRK